MIALPDWNEQQPFAGDNPASLPSFSMSPGVTFTAPLTPGTYYIGAAISQGGGPLIGGANAAGEVSYAITVRGAQAVAEPMTIAILGLGLAGLFAARRRSHPAGA